MEDKEKMNTYYKKCSVCGKEIVLLGSGIEGFPLAMLKRDKTGKITFFCIDCFFRKEEK